ncbi:MAG: DNA topoisomerase IV subunit A [Magnetococcales bacterium]|nr:DNA topoisomerase IV subunit A [Magnetococcales bacterium]MBF0261646.1 DNA topoisomerase IV subunit A [Magnetococcales bacterium]
MNPESGVIIDAPLRRELESRYLAYALSTIISRSLPDVRDGLKPVHRRILFAMRALNLDPGSAFKKSARVVGDVIGKFHPHGDQAAYDAMVRLAQEFAVRYPLVDGQGNFGNIDGDGAAAMRYTEARLTRAAHAMLEDLNFDVVDFVATYDGSLEEPTVLPSRFPNLLANGSTGIAVGMSTSIPPHNVGEIIDACLHLIQEPESRVADLLPILPGPDFPTGGVLIADASERLAVYESGRGSLRLRARIVKEDLPRGMWRLVVTEIPYQIKKSQLIERIAELIVDHKCMFLEDVRDESDEKVRIVLEPRSNRIDPDMVLAYLYKNTDLETRVTINFNVIDQGRPHVLDLVGLLKAWLAHRFTVLGRRARFELARIGERLHLLAAYLIVHLNIDEVVAIIKEHDEPAPVLMSRFMLDRDQAEAVLNLRLRSLRRLEEMEIRKEVAEKEARAKELTAMLADDRLMWREIEKELLRTRLEFSDPRRTELAGAPPPEVVLKPEDLAPREAVTVILSRLGWVRTVRGHEEIVADKLRFKGEDTLFSAIHAHANDQITFITASGKAYSILADRLPTGKGFGDPLTVLFNIEGGDAIVWMMAVDPDKEYFVVTRRAQGFRVPGADLVASRRDGKQWLVLKPTDALIHLHPVKGSLVASISRGRKLLVCDLEEFPVLSRGQGVRIQYLLSEEVLMDAITFRPEDGLTLDTGKKQKQFMDITIWRGRRATRGAMLPHGFLAGAVFAGSGVSPWEAGRGYTREMF